MTQRRRDYIHEIQTTRRHGLGGMEDFIRAYLRRHAPGILAPSALADGPLRYARVEQGRWIIDCPDCGGATLGDPDDRRFFCPDCMNASAGGFWLPVVYPESVDEIETELLRRPIANRNFLPTDTVDRIKSENSAHGVAGVKRPSVETAFAGGERGRP